MPYRYERHAPTVVCFGIFLQSQPVPNTHEPVQPVDGSAQPVPVSQPSQHAPDFFAPIPIVAKKRDMRPGCAGRLARAGV